MNDGELNLINLNLNSFDETNFIWLIYEELIVYCTNGVSLPQAYLLVDCATVALGQWLSEGEWQSGLLQLQVYNYLQSNHECNKHLNIDPYEIYCHKDNGSTCVNKSYQPKWDV